MPQQYLLTPGIAAYLEVQKLPDGKRHSAIFLSKEKGVVIDLNIDLSVSAYPLTLRAEINKHFGTVFSLAHEKWEGPGPSPRAIYCDSLIPWTVEIPDEEVPQY